MKKITSIAMLAVLCVFTTTSYAVFVHQDDYEDRTIGATCEGWLWTGNAATTHVGVYESYDGSIVREHTSAVDSTGGTTGRYGYKTSLAMTGNTSTDPADYTVSFDIRNLSGNWETLPFSIAIVSMPENYGHAYDNINVSQADGWVHVEFNLADYTSDWWNGANWDLLKPTWDIEVGFPGQAVGDGESWTQVFLVDNLKILMGSTAEPFDPTYELQNDDGTVGTLLGTYARFKLKWKAGGDPSYLAGYRVNPAIKGHYVYLSDGTDDPNLFYLGYTAQVQNADPNLTDPNSSYGPINRTADTTYRWKVEEAMADPNGNPYPAGNENNIMGPVWSFRTISIKPWIVTHPNNALVDAFGNASFSAKGSASANYYRWYKVVGQQDLPANGETDDVEKAEGTLPSTKITTLNITGATQADEGLYYCIVYYGNPDTTGTPSDPSKTAKLWYPRLMSHYPFETITDNVTPDIESGFHAEMKQAGTGSLPGLNSTDAIVGTSCLQLDNADPESADGQYAQILAGVVDYQDITISAWVRPNSVTGWRRLFDFGNGETDYLYMAPSGAGVLRFAARVDSGTEQLLDGPALTAGQWYQVTVTITGDTGRLYFNGELVATNTAMTINPIDVGAVLNYLGKSQYAADPEFDGLIDDLKIWNYARSTVEIAQDYIAVVGGSVCNRETYDMGNYDTDNNCIIDLADFVSFAARWLENDRIY